MEGLHCRKRSKQNNKNQVRKDFVTTVFSKELVLNVFSFLSSRDLIQCAAVSTEWYRLANDEMLWKPLFYKRFRDPLLLEDKRSKSHYARRSSVTRYHGSWKTKYRIHHNWLLGNCFISDIKNTFEDEKVIPGNRNHQLQFFHDILFIVKCDSSTISVWHYTENESNLEFSLRSTECNNNNNNNGYISFLKFIEGSSMNRLVAGYSNGGFTVWEVSGSSFKELKIKESVNYCPLEEDNDKIISIAMDYPMIIICSEHGKLSVFYISTSLSLKLVHCLQNPVEYSYIVIDIKKRPTGRKDIWQAIVCFDIAASRGLQPPVGVQELVLSKSKLLFSRYEYAFDDMFSTQTSILSEQITAMSYAPPFLITTHYNNTMKQYIIKANDQILDISFARKLYGHTFKVDALAIDASRRKLVSGDRSSLRVWDLAKQGECQVLLEVHKDQSKMSELPNLNIEKLGFDEDKIIAVMNTTDQTFVRLWSFNSL